MSRTVLATLLLLTVGLTACGQVATKSVATTPSPSGMERMLDISHF